MSLLVSGIMVVDGTVVGGIEALAVPICQLRNVLDMPRRGGLHRRLSVFGLCLGESLSRFCFLLDAASDKASTVVSRSFLIWPLPDGVGDLMLSSSSCVGGGLEISVSALVLRVGGCWEISASTLVLRVLHKAV